MFNLSKYHEYLQPPISFRKKHFLNHFINLI